MLFNLYYALFIFLLELPAVDGVAAVLLETALV